VIVVCGEALIDLVVSGHGEGSPSPGGGPFNTARALARLGVPTAFLGHFSTDDFGRLLAARLSADGAVLSLATFGAEPTTVAVARIGKDGLAEYDFSIAGTAAPNLTREMIPSALPSQVNALHLGTLGLLLEPIGSTLTQLLEREGERRLVMLDPNIRPRLVTSPRYRQRLEWCVSRSTVIKASAEDLAWLYPEIGYEAAAERILEAGPRLVLVTLGSAGAYGTNGQTGIRVPAAPVDVVDTIGAGDAFGAAALAWLHDHGLLEADLRLSAGELESLLEFACLAASLTCARAGAEPPWRSEIDAAYQRLRHRAAGASGC
jgi:fructokinase